MDFSVEEVLLKNRSSLFDRMIEAKLGEKSEKAIEIDAVDEIGDGNLNLVYRVSFKKSPHSAKPQSVIVKYAPPFIKILGPSYPLTQARLEVEYSGLLTYHRLSPGCVPVPLLMDKSQRTIFMEDLHGYTIMRNELIEGKVDVNAIGSLMLSLAKTHHQTSQLVCGIDEHEKMCQTFRNEDMVSITEQYVFAKPFSRDDPTNRNDPLLDEEAERLRSDARCCQRAEHMKKLFLENCDCFCHGDLHTGSVMIKDGQPKMFDIEFAFMGPGTFDFGMFLANLIFALIRHHILGDQAVAMTIKEAIRIAIESYMTFPDMRMDNFVLNTCGFIGCELIRRVIGAAHVADLSSLPEGELKALVLGRAFLLVTEEQQTNLLEAIDRNLSEHNL